MADVKITDLSAIVTPDSADVFIIDDVNVPQSKKITFGNVEASLTIANMSDYDANDNIDHTAVSVLAGDGLSGGGTIAATRTLNVDINSQSSVTAASGDELMIADVSDSNNIKKVTASSIAALSTANVIYETQYIDAGAMKESGTSGAAIADVETTTNKVNYDAFDFDAASDEYVQFKMTLPEDWDGTNIKAKFHWTDTGSGSGDVVWGIQSLPLANDDAIDAAWLAAATVTDTLIASGDLHTTSATSDLTMTGHASGDVVFFRVLRDADNGSDTFSADARLIGLTMQVGRTTNASEW